MTSVRPLTAAFFGGVVPACAEEERLAEQIGQALGSAGWRLLHGGYNGLMESAARGVVSGGGQVTAVTLDGKHAEWAPFNPHVGAAVYARSVGARLDHYLDQADVVVGMGGGVGTLHELTAAIYYAGAVRWLPVVLAGPTVRRLLEFLLRERWLFCSPTRPLDFLTPVASAQAFAACLDELCTSTRRQS